MKTNYKIEPPHMGEIIKKEMAAQGITIIDMAERLNYTRSNIYWTLSQPAINTDKLMDICKILKKNLFKPLCDWYETERLNKRG